MEGSGGQMVFDLMEFDAIIVGGGLAGLMQADILADDPLPNLRVAIIDPDPDSLSSKTFASWRLKTSPPHRYADCIENRWERFRITSTEGKKVVRDFGDYYYERIPGERLLLKIKHRLEKDSRFHQVVDSVTTINEKSDLGSSRKKAFVTTKSGQTFAAKHVFNSVTVQKPELLQYFLGFEIETEENYFDPHLVDLMDFRLEQVDEVRFVYILPFDRRRALVEFTVFAAQRISTEECESILRDYIARKLSLPNFRILKVESGAIPMTLEAASKFPPPELNSVIETIGGAAGMVKASTGYSFQRNLRHLTGSANTSYVHFRFQVYDALLLRIIRTKGEFISKIFLVLFSANSPSKIFAFLDERSSFREEIKIFFGLPWGPFLRGLVVFYPFIFAVSASIALHWTIGGVAGLIIPIIGLLTVGIGHGSLDHLLDPTARKPLEFYGLYLGSIAFFVLTWWIYPPLALGFFIFQSADHFGEANWIRAIKNSGYAPWCRVLAWMWGLFAATFGVFMHWQDASPIIQLILRDSVSVTGITLEAARWCGIWVFIAGLFAAGTLDRYERKALGRAVIGLPATLVLAASMLALPLLPGFFCFFAFWHGWDSIVAQRAANGWTAKQYISKSLRYTVASILGIGVIAWIYARSGDQNQLWQVVFLGVGALTASHAPAMKRFLKRKPPRFSAEAVYQ
jgi:lycopene beta-cyclase